MSCRFLGLKCQFFILVAKKTSVFRHASHYDRLIYFLALIKTHQPRTDCYWRCLLQTCRFLRSLVLLLKTRLCPAKAKFCWNRVTSVCMQGCVFVCVCVSEYMQVYVCVRVSGGVWVYIKQLVYSFLSVFNRMFIFLQCEQTGLDYSGMSCCLQKKELWWGQRRGALVWHALSEAFLR